MKTLAIHANEMTLKPFFGRLADETTHNPTSAGLAVTAATTHDHKEVNMNSHPRRTKHNSGCWHVAGYSAICHSGPCPSRSEP